MGEFKNTKYRQRKEILAQNIKKERDRCPTARAQKKQAPKMAR